MCLELKTLMVCYASLAKLVEHDASENKILDLGQYWPVSSTQRKNHPWPQDTSQALAKCHTNLYPWPKGRLGDGMWTTQHNPT